MTASGVSFVPRYVFLVGTPRSGGSVTLASLDGHPDVLAWPFEFTYFPFFREVAGDRQKAPVAELNDRLINGSFRDYFSKRLGHGKGIYDANAPLAAGDARFNIGGFDYQAFVDGLNRATGECGCRKYLDLLFCCFQEAHRDYRGKPIRYRVLLTAARGFDWADETLRRESLLLFSAREQMDSYASIREKALRKTNLARFFRPGAKKSALYWIETYRRISVLAEARLKDPGFMAVPLKELQADTAGMLRQICVFLNIDWSDSLSSLTICGAPYAGNANEGALNQGKVAARTSQPKTPLTTFERRCFECLGLYDFLVGAPRQSKKFGPLAAVKAALAGALLELPGDKVCGSSNPLVRWLARLAIFARMMRIYGFLDRAKQISAVVESGNSHLSSNPFWHSLSGGQSSSGASVSE